MAELDVSQPIQVPQNAVILINGKKCVLQQNPDTGQLCAYPVKDPEPSIDENEERPVIQLLCNEDGTPVIKRRRGRPRKIRTEEQSIDESEDQSGREETETIIVLEGAEILSEEPNEPVTGEIIDEESLGAESAIAGLLELSNANGEMIRRSCRVRKKAKFFDDYATSDLEGSDDEEIEEEPTTPTKRHSSRGRGRPKKMDTNNSYTQFPFYPIKRGRGRPRRYNRPDSQNLPYPIQAFIIQSSDGQALMMTPIQNLPPGSSASTNSYLPIQPATAAPINAKELSQIESVQSAASILMKLDGSVHQSEDGSESQQAAATITIPPEGSTEATEVSETTDTSETQPNKVECLNNGEEGGDADGGEEIKKCGHPAKITAMYAKDKENNKSHIQAAAFIPIPNNILPMLLPKKDSPIKIGLKATESDIEKLKCSKCEFQAYYIQQYQDHISSHSEDVEKCKCCSYLTFDKDDLTEHFKTVHPKCICTLCNFTAEHAYVIKRHMFRHNHQGCECDICGRTYKDQYILKMHVKMVHLPAEVLFECNVCTKKFTRKAHLKRHLRTHDPDKPFKCPNCEYRGCEKSDITKHMLIHEDPKHTCEVCGKTFRHIKNKELHVKRHKGQRDYKCGVCDFYGYTFTDIRKHIERKHADAKTLTCDKCGQAFKSEMCLKEHQKRQCELLMIEQALSAASENIISVEGAQISMTAEQLAEASEQENGSITAIGISDGTDEEGNDTIGHIVVSNRLDLARAQAEGKIISANIDANGQITMLMETSENGTVSLTDQPQMVAMAMEESNEYNTSQEVMEGTEIIMATDEQGHIVSMDSEQQVEVTEGSLIAMAMDEQVTMVTKQQQVVLQDENGDIVVTVSE